MHFRQHCIVRMMLCLLTVAGLLGLPAAAQAQAVYETWAETCTVKVNITEVNQTTGKFVKHTNTSTGILELYLGPDGPTQNEEGYYLKFKDADLDPRFAIRGLAIIKTEVPKSKTDSIIATGAGRFFNLTPEGTDEGPVYINVTIGTVAKNKTTGEPTSITMTFTAGGGIYPASDHRDFVFTTAAATKVVLTKQP